MKSASRPPAGLHGASRLAPRRLAPAILASLLLPALTAQVFRPLRSGPDHAPRLRSPAAVAATRTNRLAARQALIDRRLEKQPTNVVLRLQAAFIRYLRGRTNEAVQQLEAVAGQSPIAAGYLALLTAHQGGPPETVQARAQAALALLTNRLAAATNDAPAFRLMAARMHRLLGDPPAALACLQAGLARTNRPAYQRLAGTIVTEWAAATPDPAQRWRILEQAFQAGFDHPGMRRETILLSRLPGPAGTEAARWLDQRLQDPETAPRWWESLGAEALERGDTAGARRHFLRAVELAPDHPWLLNNAAALLALSDRPEDRQQALAWIDRALQAAPRQAEFHDTRGQILLAMGRLNEAIRELNTALRGRLANPAATHRALARAYRRIGREPEAALHEAAAQALAQRRALPAWMEESLDTGDATDTPDGGKP